MYNIDDIGIWETEDRETTHLDNFHHCQQEFILNYRDIHISTRPTPGTTTTTIQDDNDENAITLATNIMNINSCHVRADVEPETDKLLPINTTLS